MLTLLEEDEAWVVLQARTGHRNVAKSHTGAGSAGPWQSGASLVGGRTRRRYRLWEAQCWIHGRFNIITADVISSGNGSDDEDSSEDMIYPTVFPDWDRSVTKNEYAPSTSKELPFSFGGFLLLFPDLPDVPPPLPHIPCVKIGCSPVHLLFQAHLLCHGKYSFRFLRPISLEARSSMASRIDTLPLYLICGLPSWHVVSQGIIPLWKEIPASTHMAQLFPFSCQYLFVLLHTLDKKVVDSCNFSKQKSLSILKCLSEIYGTLLFEMLCSKKIWCSGNVTGVKLCLSLHAMLNTYLESVSGVDFADSIRPKGVHVSFEWNGCSPEPRSLAALASWGSQ
ncbi:uncharacterized protein LOC119151317 [Falco rusticolus]|uniref:uncharacterized protein LOC119151317 n=1 Tax=Falco rusticolus TaxID=120794 RepID=UPI0018867833|nr:uncharacterized protein LOC119151317 [Falco rusticolus]